MWKQYLISPLCLKCGSFSPDESLFCRICFADEIGSRLRPASFSHVPSHFYLLEWQRNGSRVMDQLAYRMKADRSAAAWRIYGGLLAEKIRSELGWSRYEALVPVPGSKQNSVHARLLAEELSRRSGLPVWDPLWKAHASEQKTRSAQERKGSPGIIKKPGVHEHFTRPVFVDDILTTGESFRQSCRALDCPEESPVLTLFYRSKAQ